MGRGLFLGVLVAVTGLAFVSCACASKTALVQGSPSDGTYLEFRNGTESRFLLVDSALEYGVFEEEVSFHWDNIGDYKATKGDKAVIISGTIRNDYEEDYFVAVTADIYNKKGEKVGMVLSPSAPLPGFAVTYVKKASSSQFEIWIKYDRQDVESYRIFMAYPPSTYPFP
ncbi:MAG TPA: hypothetical protein VMW64_05905 [Dehalococcoidia bacterium]|nr:hypothetical protein [Dehalococcoidia bacterium]